MSRDDFALEWPRGGRIVSSTGRVLDLASGPLVMGILNATPDSFYPGSRVDATNAVESALAMAAQGAGLVDIGGESTRPGSVYVDTSTENGRVIPLIREIRARCSVFISLDTRKRAVAEAAWRAGADLINDISALCDDPDLGPWLAETGLPVILMHKKGRPDTMQAAAQYVDVTAEIRDFFLERVDFALKCGIKEDKILLDPGIGFGKDLGHNLRILRELPVLAKLGFPIVLGLSRKSFISGITGAPVGERLAGSLSAGLLAVGRGANILRVHDVPETVQALSVARAIISPV